MAGVSVPPPLVAPAVEVAEADGAEDALTEFEALTDPVDADDEALVDPESAADVPPAAAPEPDAEASSSAATTGAEADATGAEADPASDADD